MNFAQLFSKFRKKPIDGTDSIASAPVPVEISQSLPAPVFGGQDESTSPLSFSSNPEYNLNDGFGAPTAPVSVDDSASQISSAISTRPLEQMPAPVSFTQNQQPAGAAGTETVASPFGMPAQLQQIEAEIARRENKDFSIKKDANGNVIHRGKDRDSDHNWWDVAKNAGLGFARGLAETGSLSAAAGAALGGGIHGAIDRNADEKTFNNFALQRERQKYASVFQREKAKQDWVFNNEKRQIEARKAALDAQGKIIGNSADQLKLVRDANKPLYDSITADNQISAEEAAMLKQAGYGDVQPYDARKFDTKEVGGVTFSSPELGAPRFNPVESLPINPEKAVREITTPAGNKYQLSQGKAADLEIAIAQGDANRAMQVLLTNNRIENENIQAGNKVRTEKEIALAERDGALAVFQAASEKVFSIESEINNLQSQLNGISPTISETTADGRTVEKINPNYNALERRLDDKRREYGNVLKTKTDAQKTMTEKESLYNRLPDPVKQKTVGNAPRLSRLPQVSQSQFIQRAKAKGLSPEQIQTAVQKAKEDGVIK